MKKLGLFLVVLLNWMPLMALEVVDAELQQSVLDSVRFTNYLGPVTVNNTVEQIQAIGSQLGSQAPESQSRLWGSPERYSIRRIHNTAQEGLSADLFILGSRAAVDHINNLNLILGGYLVSAFDYTMEEARILANTLTRYNAYYRGNWDYLASRYIPDVMAAMTPENAGLSTHYSQWPGQTHIIIPLRDTLSSGPTGRVDVDVIHDPELNREQEPDPESLEEERGLVNIREDENAREEERIRERQEEVEQERVQLQEERRTLERELEERPSPEEASTPQERETLIREEEELVERLQTIEQEEENLEQEDQDLAERQEDLRQRDEALQQDRERIVEQEQNLAGQEENTPENQSPSTDSPESVRPVVFLQTDGLTRMSQLLALDLNSGRVTQRSEINSILGRRYDVYGDDFLVIAGRAGEQTGVRLLLLDGDSLGTTLQGQDDIFPDSALVLNGPHIYALTTRSTENTLGSLITAEWVLARFDENLQVQARSSTIVDPFTALVLAEDGIMVMSRNREYVLLDALTLELRSTIDE